MERQQEPFCFPITDARCAKAPAPEKYQPCSLPVCDPGKCQNRCFQIVYKNKQTNNKGLPGWPPHARHQPVVSFDGREGKSLKRDVSLCCVCNSPVGAREGSQGPEPGDRGGRHGWIWVPAIKQWKKGEGGGRRKGKEQDKKEAAFT